MRWRLNYLAVAVLLTLLDAVVTLYYGTAMWAAWSDDILARGLLILLGAMGATSLANVWVQAGSRLRARSKGAVPSRNRVSISAEIRGQSDV
jgi:hypothetical protein